MAASSNLSEATEKSIPNWKIMGDWFDVCKCNVPCPCTFAQTPTYGDCDGVLAYLFFDEKANEEQREALHMIFSGKAGGFMAEFAALIKEVKQSEYAPINFEVADDISHWTAEVPGKVIAKAEALTGPMTPPGKRVQTINAPGSETGPGKVATWGRAITNEVDALGFKWEWNGRASKHIPFDWNRP
jgi:hypothetical protein